MKTVFKGFSTVAIVAALIGGAGVAEAETVTLKAVLSGTAEVPSKTVTGTGVLNATLDTKTFALHWKLSYSNLTGEALAAHFHGPAAPGANAGVVVPFKGSLASPIEGDATVTPAEATDILAGNWYVNIHTAANPGGELRGQLERGN